MRRLRSRSRSFSEESAANPMDGLGNLADAMLVLAVGIMLALIINWKVDIDPTATTEVEETPAPDSVTITEDDMSESEETPDESSLSQVGALYYDEETGTFYVISDGN